MDLSVYLLTSIMPTNLPPKINFNGGGHLSNFFETTVHFLIQRTKDLFNSSPYFGILPPILEHCTLQLQSCKYCTVRVETPTLLNRVGFALKGQLPCALRIYVENVLLTWAFLPASKLHQHFNES